MLYLQATTIVTRDSLIQANQKKEITFWYVYIIYTISQIFNFIVKTIDELKERIRKALKHQKESESVD